MVGKKVLKICIQIDVLLLYWNITELQVKLLGYWSKKVSEIHVEHLLSAKHIYLMDKKQYEWIKSFVWLMFLQFFSPQITSNSFTFLVQFGHLSKLRYWWLIYVFLENNGGLWHRGISCIRLWLQAKWVIEWIHFVHLVFIWNLTIRKRISQAYPLTSVGKLHRRATRWIQINLSLDYCCLLKLKYFRFFVTLYVSSRNKQHWSVLLSGVLPCAHFSLSINVFFPTNDSTLSS